MPLVNLQYNFRKKSITLVEIKLYLSLRSTNSICMKTTELTLPEWAFLDGTSQLGNLLEGRDVLQHIPSCTLIEIFTVDDTKLLFREGIKTLNFNYTNRFEEEEEHIMAVHFTLADDKSLDEILKLAVAFYCEYLDWEDDALMEENTSKQN
jgi:hypothetical protein